MQSQDQSPCSDVVGKPGEAEENDGGYMVNDLFLKILQKRCKFQETLPCSLFTHTAQTFVPSIPAALSRSLGSPDSRASSGPWT